MGIYDFEYISLKFAEDISKTSAVKFGEFKLKSGKISNYFINFGELHFGSDIQMIGNYFADYILRILKCKSFMPPDVIFGPAYKGINIAIATSIALYSRYDVNIPFAYNRKFKKDHAEGGLFVGYDLNKAKNVLIVDDVITNGGTKHEIIDMLSKYENLNIICMVVGVDRQEKDETGREYVSIFHERTGVKIYSITNKENILKFSIS